MSSEFEVLLTYCCTCYWCICYSLWIILQLFILHIGNVFSHALLIMLQVQVHLWMNTSEDLNMSFHVVLCIFKVSNYKSYYLTVTPPRPFKSTWTQKWLCRWILPCLEMNLTSGHKDKTSKSGKTYYGSTKVTKTCCWTWKTWLKDTPV